MNSDDGRLAQQSTLTPSPISARLVLTMSKADLLYNTTKPAPPVGSNWETIILCMSPQDIIKVAGLT